MKGIPKVESPFFDMEWFAHESEEIKNAAYSLYKNGFAVIDFPEPDFDEIAASIIKDLESHFNLKEWRKEKDLDLRVHDAWKSNSKVKAIAANEKILSLLNKLYGRKAIPFQTLNFPVGTQQQFHSDSVHFSSVPERFMCGVWVALEKTDENNGPLEYFPGSHKLPIFNNQQIGCPHANKETPYEYYDKYVEQWKKLVNRLNLKREVFHAQKGQAIIWASNLLHGGMAHLDKKRTRHSQVTHYFFEDCAYYTPLTNEPFLNEIRYRKITNIATGKTSNQSINGQLVPKKLIAM